MTRAACRAHASCPQSWLAGRARRCAAAGSRPHSLPSAREGSARASWSIKRSPLSATRSVSDVPCVRQAGRPAAACLLKDSGARCDAHRVLSAPRSVQHAVRHGLTSAGGPAAPDAPSGGHPCALSDSLVTLPLGLAVGLSLPATFFAPNSGMEGPGGFRRRPDPRGHCSDKRFAPQP